MFTLILENSKIAHLVYSYILKNFNLYDMNLTIKSNSITFKFKNFDYKSFSFHMSNLIIYFYESTLIKKILKRNYFYFSDFELESILKNCKLILENEDSNHKNDLIYLSVFDYVTNNSYMNLDGFVQFRLKDYLEVLDYVVDLAVNNFIINREYLKFIELLQEYISSSESKAEIIHLVYLKNESILLDEFKNPIPVDDYILDAKYLSDISFSSNDYSLNTLLNLLPKKLYIHILDEQDEFIDTLKKIFKSRVSICCDCEICNLYKDASYTIQSEHFDS